MPPHLEKSVSQVHLESGTYEEIVPALEKLMDLEALDELQTITVTQHATNVIVEKPVPASTTVKKPEHYTIQRLQRKKNTTN